MARDISLLPDDLRKKREEEERRRRASGSSQSGNAGFHVPDRESGMKNLESREPTAMSSAPQKVIAPTPRPQLPVTPIPDSKFPAFAPTPPRLRWARNATAGAQIPPRPSVASSEGGDSPIKPPDAPKHRTNGTNGKKRNGAPPKSSLHIPDAAPARALKGITLIPTGLQTAAVPPSWVRVATGGATLVAIAAIAVGAVVLDRMIGMLEATATERAANAATLAANSAALSTELERSAGTLRRAKAAHALLAAHLGWDAITRALEERTLPGVTYDAFAADAQGTIALSVRAPSVRTAAEQIVAWRSTPIVTSLESSSIASALDALGVVRGVHFDIRMVVKTNAFLAQPPDAQ